jgi:hypothetical protein
MTSLGHYSGLVATMLSAIVLGPMGEAAPAPAKRPAPALYEVKHYRIGMTEEGTYFLHFDLQDKRISTLEYMLNDAGHERCSIETAVKIQNAMTLPGRKWIRVTWSGGDIITLDFIVEAKEHRKN